MNRLKIKLGIYLMLILLATPAILTQAADEKKESGAVTLSHVNPAYEHLAEETQHNRTGNRSTYAQERTKDAVAKTVAKCEYLTEDKEVSTVIREGMVNREGEIEFHFKSENGFDEDEFFGWLDDAMRETECPDEGDYIRYQYLHIEMSGSWTYDEEDKLYYADYVLTVTYLTTAKQEAEVTRRVAEVLDDIGANEAGVTNYEKMKLIYDYICDNVSYDTENLENEEYLLKHSAYAALIDKKAVCQGYALLLYRMLEECGIDSRFIYGTGNGEAHGWNIAELGSIYYLFDATWDAGKEEYSYFLKGKEDFPNHVAESEYINDYNVRSKDYDDSKPFGEMKFVKDISYANYTGREIEVDPSLVEVVSGSRVYEFRCYEDANCSKPVKAPVEVGNYYVKAVAAEIDNYQYTETDNVHRLIVRPARVDTLNAVNKNNGIQLTWSKSKEADGYIIYKRLIDEEYEELARIEKNSTLTYLDKDIKQGKKFLYNIVAYKEINGEEVKGLKRANARQIVRATVKSITNQNKSVKLTWTKVPNAAGYKVYRKASGYSSYGLLKDIKSGSTTSYTDEYARSIRNGKASYYYVVPYYSKSSSVVLKTNTKINYYMTRPTVSSLATSGSGALKVTWKKNSSATGYQIRYSINSDMSDAKTVKVTSKNTLSKKISGLKKKKTYYVQVRSYKTYNDVKYYSGWSAKKSKKTK